MHDDCLNDENAEWSGTAPCDGAVEVRATAAAETDAPSVGCPSDVLPLQRTVNDRAFAGLLGRLHPALRALSWQLAWYDPDLRDDLEQEGRIALWRVNPLRLAATVNPAGYQRAVIRHAMLRHLRTLSRQDPGETRIDWRIVEEVLESFGERRDGGRRAA